MKIPSNSSFVEIGYTPVFFRHVAMLSGLLYLLAIAPAEAQLGRKVKRAAERSAERTIERKVSQETEEKTEQVLDSIFNAPGQMRKKENEVKEPVQAEQEAPGNQTSSAGDQPVTNEGYNIRVAEAFIPNGQITFYDDFSEDALGDFPYRWETNSSGEVISIDDVKALRVSGTGFYTPMLAGPLPDHYAIEFDLYTDNLHYKNSTPARLKIQLVNEAAISKTKAGAALEIPLWYQGATKYVLAENWGTPAKISNKIPYDFTDRINGRIHFTLVKNGKRIRLFMDHDKVVDMPSLSSGDVGSYFQLYVRGIDLQKDLMVAIAHYKVTEEGEDLRSMLMSTEGFSTTNILFDSGSDRLKAVSYDFLNKLGEVLLADPAIRVLITGHTDSDGDAAANLALSEKRAMAVKNYLTAQFGMDERRLQTEGKGESEPLNSNASAAEKARNRRVAFVKLD